VEVFAGTHTQTLIAVVYYGSLPKCPVLYLHCRHLQPLQPLVLELLLELVQVLPLLLEQVLPLEQMALTC
jgi:hypothetical protein